MTRKNSKFRFRVGDRVSEKPRISMGVAVKRENQRVYQSRTGTVTELLVKYRKDGHQRKYLMIRWDGSKAPSEHEQMRICAAQDLKALEQELIANHG